MGGAGTTPKPSRLGCGAPRSQRAEPAGARRPPRRSQPPRGGLTPSRPWGGAGASAALPGGRPSFGARARLHLHPSGLTASRLGPHRSGSSFGGTRSCQPPRPLRLARAEAGARSRARASQRAAGAPARPSPLSHPLERLAAGRHAPEPPAAPPRSRRASRPRAARLTAAAPLPEGPAG